MVGVFTTALNVKNDSFESFFILLKENYLKQIINKQGGKNMERILDILKRFYKEGIIILLLIGLIVMGYLYFNKKTESNANIKTDELAIIEEEEVTEEIYVDIKGEVKKPGVYKIVNGSIVNDLITLSGGLTKNGTTKNINLSKKITSEMVIVVANKKSLESTLTIAETICKCEEVEITECITNEEVSIVSPTEGTTPEVEEVSTKVSINKATKEQLMTLSGIGESKALSIISYRETNGAFKTIEEIMDVTGIGEAIFAQIKESITI